MQEKATGNSADENTSGGHVTLRELLTRALRNRGFGVICKDEPGTNSRPGEVFSQNLLFSVLTGLILFASFRLGWNFWLTLGVIAGSLLIITFTVMAGGCTNTLAYLAYLTTWLALGVVLLKNRDYDTILLTHALPFALVIGGRWAARAVRFTAHVPFFVPITLLLILMPLISEDPWRVAAAAQWRIGLLAALTLLPLCAYLVVRLAKLDVATTLFQIVDELNAREIPLDTLWDRIDKFRNRSTEFIGVEDSKNQLGGIFDADKETTTARMVTAVAAIEKRFRRIAFFRVLSIVGGVCLAVTTLIYLLAVVIMPAPLAAGWSQTSVTSIEAALFAWSIDIPTGPYLYVSLLLGTVASVGFAGFVLTESQYFESFTRGVIGKPAEEYVLFALPYFALKESAKDDS